MSAPYYLSMRKKLITLASLCILGWPAAASETETAKPNVIVILPDDMGCGDIAALGGRQGTTPNPGRLAKLALGWRKSLP
jgi:hypothetical protein